MRHCVLVLSLFAFVRSGHADPHHPVVQADVDRLEKKLDDQRRLLERLILLQEQYAHSLLGLLPEGEAKPEPAKPIEPRPPSKPAPNARGTGTIVGKISGVKDAILYL